MADVVVVGASIAGMAAAARLAKLGHDVVLLERRDAPGGVARKVEQDGFGWDAGPSSITLPAVFRDLFRKSGRPLEKYVDLRLRDVACRHVFADSSSVDLPSGSRGAQIAAVDAGLGDGRGQEWADFVDAQAGLWEVLRREVLDQPTGGVRFGDRSVARSLRASTSLAKALARSLSDSRLREMAAATFVVAGSEPRDVPAFGTVQAYVERTFGVWEVDGGQVAVTAALVTRLAERRVDLRLGCAATRVGVSDGAVIAVHTSSGEVIDTPVVVTANDPGVVLGTLVDAGAAAVARHAFAEAVAIPPPEVSYLGLRGDVPTLPSEVVFHGDPMLVLTTTGDAPPGGQAWTIQRRGRAAGDVLDALAVRGIDVRSKLVTRRDLTPAEFGEAFGRSAYGLRWDRPRTYARRCAQQHPLTGLYLIGSSTHPGASMSYAAWGAAHAATLIGKPV